jgi:glycosyltransferase involved in cell wall biosynthesis
MKRLLFSAIALASLGVVAIFHYSKEIPYDRDCDVAIMGTVSFNDGIGRQTIGLIDCLRERYSVAYLRQGGFDRKDLPKEVESIVNRKYTGTPAILIYEEALFFPTGAPFPKLPNAQVKIAYSMIESTKIPREWTKILNHEFDAVIVPDQFLVDVYRNCGVKIPIFVIPVGMYLEPFVQRSHLHEKPQNRPFTFGCLGTYLPRKNQIALLRAFAKAFGNDPNVQLVMNGRSAEMDYLNILRGCERELDLRNVTIKRLPLKWKRYINKISSLDCYVSPSLGEGFSLQPREALALGIPCIVTDNTAQTTICKTGYVRAVPCRREIKARYKVFQSLPDDLGVQFECEVDELAQAMRDVYDNYETYALKAYEGRNWVNQYRYESLRALYETIVLPKKVVLGDCDRIEEGVIYTTSEFLKKKYESIIRKNESLQHL